ncbi:hypothetical protein D3C85_1825730 [compost metagenome]
MNHHEFCLRLEGNKIHQVIGQHSAPTAIQVRPGRYAVDVDDDIRLRQVVGQILPADGHFGFNGAVDS